MAHSSTRLLADYDEDHKVTHPDVAEVMRSEVSLPAFYLTFDAVWAYGARKTGLPESVADRLSASSRPTERLSRFSSISQTWEPIERRSASVGLNINKGTRHDRFSKGVGELADLGCSDAMVKMYKAWLRTLTIGNGEVNWDIVTDGVRFGGLH